MHYYRGKPPVPAPPQRYANRSRSSLRSAALERLSSLPRATSTIAPAFQDPQTTTSAPAPSGAAKDTRAPSSRIQEAAALVPAAAAILDEDMAAGILAARDVRAAHNGSPATRPAADNGTDVLRKLHDLIDASAALWPLLKAATTDLYAHGDSDAGTPSTPVLRPHGTVAPGRSADIAMKLSNDATEPARLTLCCTDLVCPSGSRIAQERVKFFPRTLHLEPDGCADVKLKVDVPAGSMRGTYKGLLLASGLPYLQAIICVEVT